MPQSCMPLPRPRPRRRHRRSHNRARHWHHRSRTFRVSPHCWCRSGPRNQASHPCRCHSRRSRNRSVPSPRKRSRHRRSGICCTTSRSDIPLPPGSTSVPRHHRLDTFQGLRRPGHHKPIPSGSCRPRSRPRPKHRMRRRCQRCPSDCYSQDRCCTYRSRNRVGPSHRTPGKSDHRRQPNRPAAIHIGSRRRPGSRPRPRFHTRRTDLPCNASRSRYKNHRRQRRRHRSPPRRHNISDLPHRTPYPWCCCMNPHCRSR
jgi:hypothetical protein